MRPGVSCLNYILHLMIWFFFQPYRTFWKRVKQTHTLTAKGKLRINLSLTLQNQINWLHTGIMHPCLRLVWLGKTTDEASVFHKSRRVRSKQYSNVYWRKEVLAQRIPLPYLDWDLINLVQDVDARHVDTVALNGVNEVLVGGIHAQRDVGIVNLVLGQDGLYHVRIQMRLCHLHTTDTQTNARKMKGLEF